MHKLNNHISTFLPGYIALCAILASNFPDMFTFFYNSTSFLLGLVLFLAGLSMRLEDLRNVKESTVAIITGVFLKWTITVILSVVLANLFFFHSPDVMRGLILTGSVPSGTAATMYTALAGGSVPLSVAMGVFDVFISPILTPVVLSVTTNDTVIVSFLDLVEKMMYIVIIPMTLGITVRFSIANRIHLFKPYFKLTSSLTILLIVYSVVGSVGNTVSVSYTLIFSLIVVVFFQVLIPMLLGYKIALTLKFKRENAIAMLFEVGLCNSALAAILALEFFGGKAALPAIINMILNLSIGAFLSNRLLKKNKIF